VLRIVMVFIGAVSFSHQAQADQAKLKAYATGNITSQVFCSATEVCQEAIVSGFATLLGQFTGHLFERVDITTRTYTGTGVFTTANGDTISTEYDGQVTPPDENGRVFFFEDHVVVGGTGRFATATGELNVTGTADATGQIIVVVMGTLER
jgi:hypothetical protein